jgi:sarcosine oxidase, subunit alpha
MSRAIRIASSPSQLVDRGRPIVFEYNNRRIEAWDGDTIASAMLASGVDVFSRSFKYHRPRGLLCCEGHCPNCMMGVDGSPNVRACTEPARAGMKVIHQNAWPSPEFDVLATTGAFDFMMPVGFYYKTFFKPRFMWPQYERVIRQIAGLGRIDPSRVPPYEYDKQHLRTDVAVVGAGPAGLSAALAAAEAGVQVALVDENPFLGGHYRFQSATSREFGEAQDLETRVRARPNIRILSNATAFGFYEGGMLGIFQGRREIRLRTKRLVLASGLIERPVVFGNNDLPGVMLGRAVQRLIHLHGVRPGSRAVVVGSNSRSMRVAADLAAAGVEIAAYADRRAQIDETADARSLRDRRVTMIPGVTSLSARGSSHVERVSVGSRAGTPQQIDCDLLVLATGGDPAIQLLQQAGARGRYDTDRHAFLADVTDPHHFVAGDANGVHGPDDLVPDGRRAGLAAAQSLSAPTGSTEATQFRETRSPFAMNVPQILDADGGGKRFVCVCEDVTEKDVCDAVAEGFDNIETLKRYSTVSMGPCQGKMCQMAAIAICAHQTSRTIEETGTTTARPPYNPITLGVLAGRNHHPYKIIPTHSRHLATNARVISLGDWLRPEVYTTPAEECRAVHERVGLIDVSTLGCLDVRGPDVAKLLDRVYINGWSNLKVGRTRYGVMCDDAGIIFDDGTCARLAEEQYYLTATTSGADTVYQWLQFWLAESPWDVCVTNVTSGYGAVNLAGPRARDVLGKVTAINLDSAAFPYLGCAQGVVAGVPSILFRIGFVGELGYEIHFPAEYGDHMWDALMEAGKDFGISPFGVESQRILRLEKQHIIVTQDTDALSNPLEANLSWAVKFDKPDFVGKRALLAVRQAGLRNQLVGFVATGGRVPDEGAQVMENGRSVGRVTSARLSPYLNQIIGLAWVPLARAKEGEPIAIRAGEATIDARVATRPFYDPDGARMKA